MTRFHQLTAIALGLATMAAGAPAIAQDQMFEPTSRTIRFDDLNLSNERGRERLERRVRHAADSACGYRDARTLTEKQAAEQCRANALDNAKPKVADAVRKAEGSYSNR